jgi:hypothetical protein
MMAGAMSRFDEQPSAPPVERSQGFLPSLPPAVIALFLVALAVGFDSIPGGLCNDAIQEVQTGYNAVFRDGLSVMAFDPSINGVETLWVGIAGVLVRLLGHETLSVVMSSWLAVGLMLVFLWLLARRHPAAFDPMLVVLAAISMPWLFHYGRSGMRCIASATFLAANLVALSLFLEKPRSWLGAATLGGSLALGIYAYTSSRVPPLAYALFALGQIVHAGHERWVWLAGHARVVFVATLMSLPNILYAVREPEKFFGRGQYNVVGTAGDRAWFIAESLALPLWYDNARYTTIVGLRDGVVRWAFEAVAVALPLARMAPVPLLTGLAMLGGLAIVPRLDRAPRLVMFFGLLTYALTASLIGFMGPSESRLAILIPVVALCAGAGLTFLARQQPSWSGLVVPAGMALLAAFTIGTYCLRMPAGRYQRPYALAAIEAGRAARDLAAAGSRVLVIVAKDRNTVEYLAADQRGRVAIMEFFDRPFDIRELELDRLLPDAIVVSLDPSGPESAANPSFIGAVHRLREWSRESPTVAGSFVVLRPRLGP